jgi:membrane-bound metal-dependent hydrolase YbcI (DUF457 family)
MDPFTHLLLAYLITFGIFGPSGLQYVVAGALAGALPDADVIFFPLSRWVPLLRHRGISHSILGVTVIAALGTWLVPLAIGHFFGPGFAAGAPGYYFLAMEAGGLSHILLDALDHWSVPVFAPFSQVEYHFDADRIVNVGAMTFTVVSYGLMLYERGRVPLWFWEVTAWTLLALAATYFAVRLTGRWRAGRVARRDGYTDLVPQANPFIFLLVHEELTPERAEVRFAPYHLLRGYLKEPRTLSVSKGSPGPLPVRDASEALERSYGPALEQAWALGETHHFGEVVASGTEYEVFWYSLEFSFFGRSAGAVAWVDAATGKVRTRSVWRAPPRPFW